MKKKSIKKFFSYELFRILLLSLCLSFLFSGKVSAWEIHQTDLFDEVSHEAITVSDKKSQVYDLNKYDELEREVLYKTEIKKYQYEVMELFEQMLFCYNEASSAQMLAYIKQCEQPQNEELASIYQQNSAVKVELSNRLLFAAQTISDSPCNFLTRLVWGVELYEEIQEEELFTDEQKALMEQENIYINDYMEQYSQSNEDQAYKERNKALGGIFVQLIELRKKQADSFGYADYQQYAYDTLYEKEYSREDIAAFREKVKQYVVPMRKTLYQEFDWDAFEELEKQYFDEQKMLEILQEYIPQISSEVGEALTYMEENRLYDWSLNPQKRNVNYTTLLPSYRAPYMYRYSTNSFWDFKTTIHEFGHYNACYQEPGEGWGTNSDYDLAEVHSQGLEMLFLEFYPQIFGENAGIAREYLVYCMLSNIVEGCLYDELQEYAYTSENVTLKDLNRKFCQLCIAYGLLASDQNYEEAYGWVEIPHNYESPFYYISYALSAETAVRIFMDSLYDREEAIDKYLMTVKDSSHKKYLERLEESSINSPFAEEELPKLMEELDAYLKN